MTSKCGKNKKVAPSVSLMLLPHFDVFFDLFLNRRTATWNLSDVLGYSAVCFDVPRLGKHRFIDGKII